MIVLFYMLRVSLPQMSSSSNGGLTLLLLYACILVLLLDSLYFLISSSASWCSIIGAMGLSVQPGISFASLARLGLQAPSFIFGSSTGCLLIFCGLLVIWFWRARFCRHARLPVGSHTRSAGPPREPQGIWSGPL